MKVTMDKLTEAIDYSVEEKNTEAVLTIKNIDFQKLGEGEYNITVKPVVELSGGGKIEGGEYNITVYAPEPWEKCFAGDHIEINAPKLAARGVYWAISAGIAAPPAVKVRITKADDKSCSQYTYRYRVTVNLEGESQTGTSYVEIPDPRKNGLFTYTAKIVLEVNAANKGGSWTKTITKKGKLLNKTSIRPKVEISKQNGEWNITITPPIPEGCKLAVGEVLDMNYIGDPEKYAKVLGAWVQMGSDIKVYSLDKDITQDKIYVAPLAFYKDGDPKGNVTFTSDKIGYIYLPNVTATGRTSDTL